jgi:hypothetical protein
VDKKQFRKDIEAKLGETFGHLAEGAEKKFKKLVKKLSHLLTDGLHKPEPKPAKAKKRKAASQKTLKKDAKKTARKAVNKTPGKAK